MKNQQNIQLSDNSIFLPYNTSNYKQHIENSIQEILDKFIEIILKYMKCISEKNIMRNITYYKFIFERGIETLIHVFYMFFYYTKNLGLTFYHTQNACYLYIEFIEQISDDNIKFLQLSSRDAILYVYKKTIFELNNEYKKNISEPSADEKIIFETIDNYSQIYKKIILFVINHEELKYENKVAYIDKCCGLIQTVSNILNKNKIKPNNIEYIHLFVSFISVKELNIDNFFILVNEFSKKISGKKKIDDNKIKSNIYEPELNDFLSNNLNINGVVDRILS